jgi:hypothetical protein
MAKKKRTQPLSSSHSRLASLIVVFTIGVLGATSQAQAASSPKIGSKCTKIGLTQISKTFTYTLICAKKGNKKVWIKYEVEKKIEIPISLRSEVAIKIQKIIDESQNSVPGEPVSIEWKFEDISELPGAEFSTAPKVKDIISSTKAGLENAIKFYSSIGFETPTTQIYIFQDQNWANNQLQEITCLRNATPTMGWFVPKSFCRDGKARIFGMDWRKLNGLRSSSIQFQHTLAHEYMHQIQSEAMGGNFFPLPLWFSEGGANFFSSLAYSTWNKNVNYEAWLDILIRDRNLGGYWECISSDYSKIFNGTWETKKCAYSKGSKAVEYFVSKFGTAKYLEVFKGMKSKSFEQAFLEVTQENLMDFLKETEIYLISQGWSK